VGGSRVTGCPTPITSVEKTMKADISYACTILNTSQLNVFLNLALLGEGRKGKGRKISMTMKIFGIAVVLIFL